MFLFSVLCSLFLLCRQNLGRPLAAGQFGSYLLLVMTISGHMFYNRRFYYLLLSFLNDDRVLMVRQYRYVQQESHRWEMPTGGMHAGETPEVAAQRELQEEVGYSAGRLEWVSSYYTSKSVCDETAHLYLGYDLVPAALPPDETEFLEIAALPFADVLDLVLRSEIRDSMTVIAVLHAARLRGWQSK